jgi:hypothetical protein
MRQEVENLLGTSISLLDPFFHCNDSFTTPLLHSALYCLFLFISCLSPVKSFHEFLYLTNNFNVLPVFTMSRKMGREVVDKLICASAATHYISDGSGYKRAEESAFRLRYFFLIQYENARPIHA